MSQLSARTFRFALNQATTDQLTNKLSSKPLQVPRGNGCAIQCAAFRADPAKAANLVTDLSNIVSITYVIRKTNASGDMLVQRTIAAEDFDNPALQFTEWAENTSQHFSIILSGTDTNQVMPAGKTELPIYIAIQADTVGDPILLGTGTGTIFEEGIGGAGAPTPGDPLYYTSEQADTRFARRGVTAADFRSDFTARTGGTASDADSLATLTLDAGYLLAFVVTGEGLRHFQLKAGTTAVALPGSFRPTDYHADTNAKYWESV
jgi:hypothetical protein